MSIHYLVEKCVQIIILLSPVDEGRPKIVICLLVVG